MNEQPPIVTVASGVDPAEIRRLVQRIEELEGMLREQAERHTGELALKDQVIERITSERDDAIRALRINQQAEEQEVE